MTTLHTPYWTSPDGRHVIYNQNCLDVLPHLTGVDAVITSPPYNIGNSPKGSFYDGKKKGTHIKYLSHDDDMPEPEYIAWQHLVLTTCFATLKDAGVIAYNHKPRIVGLVYDDRKKLVPLPIRQEIVWDRACMVNFCGSFFAPSTERVYLIAKRNWKPQRKCVGWGEVWRIAPEENNDHPAPFPLELARRLSVSCAGDSGIVCDPFTGSGTTGVACIRTGRRFIGIELEPKYCAIAVERMERELSQPCLPTLEPTKATQEVLL